MKAFAAHAMQAKVPFAVETVFSQWEVQEDGTILSKLDMITDLQAAGYFVLLFFVGLVNVELSILRVMTRVAEHGHGVPQEKLIARFPRTKHAIRRAAGMADAAILRITAAATSRRSPSAGCNSEPLMSARAAAAASGSITCRKCPTTIGPAPRRSSALRHKRGRRDTGARSCVHRSARPSMVAMSHASQGQGVPNCDRLPRR